MSHIRLDFIPRSRMPGLWTAAAVVVLAAIFVYALIGYVQVTDSIGQLARQSAALKAIAARSLPSAELTTTRAPIDPQRAKSMALAVAALNVPWPAILEAVERSASKDVDLLAIETRSKDHAIVITAQAQRMVDLIAFMDRLAHSSPFVDVVPLRQEAMPGVDGSRYIASLELHWSDGP